MRQYVAYMWVKSLWLIIGAQIECVWLNGIFPSGAMAVSGVLSQSKIRPDGVMPPGVLLSE